MAKIRGYRGMTSGASTVIRAPAEAERSTVIALSVGESATGQIVGVCGCVWSGGYKGNKKRMRLAPKKKKTNKHRFGVHKMGDE